MCRWLGLVCVVQREKSDCAKKNSSGGKKLNAKLNFDMLFWFVGVVFVQVSFGLVADVYVDVFCLVFFSLN